MESLTYHCFDFDDNILHTSSPIYLERWCPYRSIWFEIKVTTAQFATIRQNMVSTRYPDNDPARAFIEFSDFGERGKAGFLFDAINAMADKRFGPCWSDFRQVLLNGDIFAIITGRGNSNIISFVKYIISHHFDKNEQFAMYQNCLAHANYFSSENGKTYPDVPDKFPFHENELIKDYLKYCRIYATYSPSFKEKYGDFGPMGIETAKQVALDDFIKKCNQWANMAGAKKVSICFSDDDPSNVEHICSHLKRKSALSHDYAHDVVMRVVSTTNGSTVPIDHWTSRSSINV